MYKFNKQNGNVMLIGLIIVIIVFGGGYLLWQSSQSSDNKASSNQEVTMEDGVMGGKDKMMADEGNHNNEVMEDDSTSDDKMMDGSDSMMENDEGAMMDKGGDVMAAGTYVDYSKSTYDAAAGKKRVLFFHAKWCPTCKVANADFVNNQGKIPADVVLLKTDYDTETALKQKYGITYQHTFVQVDSQGNEIAKWNGGGTDELIKKIK